MIGLCKSATRNNLVARGGTRRLGVERLDSRLMMTASPLLELDTTAAALLETPVEVDPVAEVADTSPLVRQAAFPGGGGAYPNPEDDDGDWGPWGPWVHDALHQVGNLLDTLEVERESMPPVLGGGDFYPAPDDDGPWGPIGPVIHEGLLAAGDANGDLVVDQHDIVQILKAAKYMTTERADFSEGDFNRDGLFNQRDIVAMQQAGHYMRGPYHQLRVDQAVIGLFAETAVSDGAADIAVKPRPPIVKDIDVDGDGTPDMRFYDSDGDGDADLILQNTDDDKNADGTPNWDRGVVDGDGDNDYDHFWSDTNGDGKVDPNEVRRMPNEKPIIAMP